MNAGHECWATRKEEMLAAWSLVKRVGFASQGMKKETIEMCAARVTRPQRAVGVSGEEGTRARGREKKKRNERCRERDAGVCVSK
jgi:hypothetical protein